MVSVRPRPLFTTGNGPVPIVQEAGWAPGPVWTGAKNLTPTGIFFTIILYWSRYRLSICKSILSRQSFVSFMSRHLGAEVVASDVPCLPIGSSSLCFCLLLLLGTVPFAVLLLCNFRGP